MYGEPAVDHISNRTGYSSTKKKVERKRVIKTTKDDKQDMTRITTTEQEGEKMTK